MVDLPVGNYCSRLIKIDDAFPKLNLDKIFAVNLDKLGGIVNSCICSNTICKFYEKLEHGNA